MSPTIAWILIGALGCVILILILFEIQKVTMKVSEVAGALEALNTQVQKIAAEVQKLIDSLADVDLPPAAETALNNLKTAIQGVDDLNPDEPPTPT